MERIKWVWLTDSQAAKQSHDQSLLTYLLTHSLTHSLSHSLTHSVNQSINQSINRSINQWIQKYVTHIKYHICDRREIDRLICVCIVENTMITFKYIPSDSILLQATEIYLFYATLLNQKNYQVYILFTKLAPFLPQSWDLLEKLPLVLSVYFFCIILSDAYISISSLSGSLHMFITSWWLIKRSPQTLQSENNYMFTKRWSGWILLPL